MESHNSSWNQPQLQKEHLLWKSECEIWLHDIETWDRESEYAVSEIKLLIQNLHNHMSNYERHRKGIGVEIEQVQIREKELSANNSFTNSEQEIVNYHILIGRKHTSFRQRHEQIKKYHYKLMALISCLKKSIESEI